MSAAPIRVVVVDDHPSFRRAARELLAWRGYAVVGEAACAEAALALVAGLAPDAAVVDVRLGADDGRELARLLRGRHPGLGILLVTAGEDRRPCPAAHGPLAKPRLAEIDLGPLLAPPPG